MIPQSSYIRYRRHWGISPKTRYQLGECDALVSAIRASPVPPAVQARLIDMDTSDEARTVMELAEIESREPLGVELLPRLHRLAAGGPEEDGLPRVGAFRTDPARADYPVPGAEQVPELTAGLFNWLDRDFPPAVKGGNLGSAVIRALVTHVYLLWIRPFAEGNSRTARLAEACVLLDAGYPAVAARIPSAFYGASRPEYLRQLRLAARERSLTSFISFAAAGLRNGLVDLHDAMRRAHFASAWRGFVLDRLEGHPHRKRTVLRRRRDLMLALPLDGTRDIEEIAQLDQHTVRLYSGLSQRTLRRDLDFLVRTGLVSVTRGRFAVNTDPLRLR